MSYNPEPVVHTTSYLLLLNLWPALVEMKVRGKGKVELPDYTFTLFHTKLSDNKFGKPAIHGILEVKDESPLQILMIEKETGDRYCGYRHDDIIKRFISKIQHMFIKLEVDITGDENSSGVHYYNDKISKLIHPKYIEDSEPLDLTNDEVRKLYQWS